MLLIRTCWLLLAQDMRPTGLSLPAWCLGQKKLFVQHGTACRASENWKAECPSRSVVQGLQCSRQILCRSQDGAGELASQKLVSVCGASEMLLGNLRTFEVLLLGEGTLQL